MLPTSPVHRALTPLSRREAFSTIGPSFAALYYGQRFSATLEIKRFTGKLTHQLPDDGIRRCARSGERDTTMCQKRRTSFDGLPKIYYGMVRRRCLQSVKVETGSYFPGPSPDMSGAVAVSKYVQHMCYVDYPIFIPGCCMPARPMLHPGKRG